MSKKIPPAVANAIIDGALDLIPDTEPKTKGGKIMRVIKKVGKILFTFVKIK